MVNADGVPSACVSGARSTGLGAFRGWVPNQQYVRTAALRPWVARNFAGAKGASWTTASGTPDSGCPLGLESLRGVRSRIGVRFARVIPTEQPGHGRDDRQAHPIQSSFDGLLHPRCLSAQGYARGERIPRERPCEHPGCQMSFWTAPGTISQIVCGRVQWSVARENTVRALWRPDEFLDRTASPQRGMHEGREYHERGCWTILGAR